MLSSKWRPLDLAFNVVNDYPPVPFHYSAIRMGSSPEDVTKTVFDLYRKYGTGDYIGEKVTQEAHAVQCASWAEKEDGSVEVRMLRMTAPKTTHVGHIEWRHLIHNGDAEYLIIREN